MPNLLPLIRAFNHILAHPETWDQQHWHCGTTHCLFGHCQILAGLPAYENTCYADVVKLTDISESDASWLSNSQRTLVEIRDYIQCSLADKAYFDADGYNRHGYNRDGYDRAGYDRDGYNRAGYDRAGYDRAGYDRDGYDRAGYDRYGYDRAGYDRYGYDRAGYDRDGYNRAGYNRAGYDRDGYKLQPLPVPLLP